MKDVALNVEYIVKSIDCTIDVFNGNIQCTLKGLCIETGDPQVKKIIDKVNNLSFIDYWAVDTDFGRKKCKWTGVPVFTSCWQDFRRPLGKKKKKHLDLKSPWLPRIGNTAAIQVIDVFTKEYLTVLEIP